MPAYGETRNDGYRFKGYRSQGGKRYEHWLSPAAWEAKQARMRAWRAADYAANLDNRRASAASYAHAARRTRPVVHMLARARTRAKAHGLAFTIDASHITIPEVCPVFGVPLCVGGGECAPELDRIQNDRGYEPGNVLVVSRRANRLKNDATLAELQTLVHFYEVLLC